MSKQFIPLELFNWPQGERWQQPCAVMRVVFDLRNGQVDSVRSYARRFGWSPAKVGALLANMGLQYRYNPHTRTVTVEAGGKTWQEEIPVGDALDVLSLDVEYSFRLDEYLNWENIKAYLTASTVWRSIISRRDDESWQHDSGPYVRFSRIKSLETWDLVQNIARLETRPFLKVYADITRGQVRLTAGGPGGKTQNGAEKEGGAA